MRTECGEHRRRYLRDRGLPDERAGAAGLHGHSGARRTTGFVERQSARSQNGFDGIKGTAARLAGRIPRERTIDVVPFDEPLSNLAFEAYCRFGKGRHPAKLNMGDCAAYALAKSRGWPLLFKGDDFTQTDVERA